ncbi:MAG: hypothetical protein RIT81_38485 [Deltaproteobacteria bacterium]
MKRLAAFALVLAGCGSEPPTLRTLTLAETYDLSGVRRTFTDRLSVTAQDPFTLTLEQVLDSGGQARATLRRTEGATPSIDLMGSFESADGRITFMPTSGAVWTDRIDVIDGVGGNAFDAKPTDGLANEIVGFVQTSSGSRHWEASFLAVARTPNRPEPLDAAGVTVSVPELGVVRIEGSAGTAPGSAGIEVFRHQMIERDADFTLHQALDDGSFNAEIVGFSDDLLLLRARVAGRAGTTIAVVAP